ncbi:DUF6408 family protein [Streptomyces sp. INA 01156]
MRAACERVPGGPSTTIPAHHRGVVARGPCRIPACAFRRVLADVAVNAVANLLTAAMMSAAHLLF